jgi:hypothetical protein
VKICVVQWRRKGKETESWTFFGGFEVAGVGLSEWVACGWRKWACGGRCESRSALWRVLPARRAGSAGANQASRKQPSRGVIVNVGRSNLSKIPIDGLPFLVTLLIAFRNEPNEPNEPGRNTIHTVP